MNALKHIKDFFSAITASLRKSGNIDTPSRDWKLVITVFFIAVVILVLVSGYLFLEIKADGTEPSEESSTREVFLDRSKLRDVLNSIERKKQTFELRKKSPISTPDPSL